VGGAKGSGLDRSAPALSGMGNVLCPREISKSNVKINELQCILG